MTSLPPADFLPALHLLDSSPAGSAGHPDILSGPLQPELIRAEVLADILEATAARIPHQVALMFADRHLTYEALNAQADQVASGLIDAEFECAPLEAKPSTTSPAVMLKPLMIFSLSTQPTAKPAKSYSPAGYMPGISAVSPPTSAQPDCSQPSAMPLITCAAVPTSSLPQAK